MAEPRVQIRIDAAQGDAIRQFLESKRALASLGEELSKAKAKATELAGAMRANGDTKAVRAFEAARVEAGRLKQAFADQSVAVQRARSALSGSGVDVSKLAAEHRRLKTEIAGTPKAIDESAKSVSRLHVETQKLRPAMADLSRTLVGLFSTAALGSFVRSSVSELSRAEAAFKGLEAVANGTGTGIADAFETAKRLAADGLIDVASASAALQNLLSRGYDIQQAEQTLIRLKDAAAFNRTAHLTLSQAVLTASEGLKNENSILVDNAGVTKNVSKIWEDYARSIGKTVGELTQAEKIQAEVAGIAAETAFQTGNAAKAAEGFQGAQAKLNAALTEFKVAAGDSLTPVLTNLAKVGTDLVKGWLAPFITGVQKAGAVVAFLGQSVGILLTESFATLPQRLSEAKRALNDTLKDISDRANAPSFVGSNLQGANPARQAQFRAKLNEGGKPKKEKVARTKQVQDLTDERLAVERAGLEASTRLEEDAIQRVRDAYRVAYDSRLIDARAFYEADGRLQQQALDAKLRALETDRNAQATRASNPAGTEQDRLRAAAEVKRLDADIAIARRDRGRIEVESARASAQAERELSQALAGVRLQLAEASGTLGLQDRRAAIQEQNRGLIEQLTAAQDTRGLADVNRLIDTTAATQQLQQYERQAQQVIESLRLAEERLRTETETGLLSESQAQRQLVQERQKVVPQLNGILSEMDALGAATGSAFGSEQINNIERLRQSVEGLARTTNPLKKQLQGIAENNLGDFLFNLATRAGTAKEAIANMARSIANDLARLAAQKLAVQFLSAAFGGGGGGGAAPPLFAADGGHIRGPGTSTSDSIPAMLSDGEFVVRAAAVKQWGVGFLSWLNAGIAPPRVRDGRMGFAAGGLASAAAAPASTPQSVSIVNLLDPGLVGSFLSTNAGEKAVLNVLRRNGKALKTVI
jgi:hypothetical protein